MARLVRVRIGSLRLENLRPGEVRALTATERDRLVAGSQRRTRSSGVPAPSSMVVSIDGPGSSGKSSVGAAAALELGFRFCDTGVLYRALAWLALERGMALGDAEPADRGRAGGVSSRSWSWPPTSRAA